jgi:hypothetical protein
MMASFSSAQSLDEEMKSGTTVRLAIDASISTKVNLDLLDIPVLALHRFEEPSAALLSHLKVKRLPRRPIVVVPTVSRRNFLSRPQSPGEETNTSTMVLYRMLTCRT